MVGFALYTDEAKEFGAGKDEYTKRKESQSSALEKYGLRHAFEIKSYKFVVDKFFAPKKCLGSGAYGVVCSCIDARNGNRVAIKMIPRTFDDFNDAKRILREIKLMQFLQHPNVVQLVDMVNPLSKKDFQNIYMVMEQMDSDLHRVIHSKNVLTEDHFRFFMYQLLCALKFMHAGNVIHRDLKPSNLLVDSDCTLKVCDFGLARGVSSDWEEDDLTEYVVTRWYRAPEIMCSCQEYGPQVDVWSAGCILAEMIAKKPLFPGDSYIHQLNLMLDLLGSPNPEDLGWMTNQKACQYLLGMSRRERIPLRRILDPSMCSDECIDLLEKMIVFNPEKRISVDDALSHPFFSSIRKEDQEFTPSCQFDFSFERGLSDTKEIRNIFFDEICHYRPEAQLINPLDPSEVHYLPDTHN